MAEGTNCSQSLRPREQWEHVQPHLEVAAAASVVSGWSEQWLGPSVAQFGLLPRLYGRQAASGACHRASAQHKIHPHALSAQTMSSETMMDVLGTDSATEVLYAAETPRGRNSKILPELHLLLL